MTENSQKRRLSAVMFTDIKDFTAMMESDEVTAVGLVKAQREIIREQVALHDGEERETIGDAFLVIFESAVKAVECAIDIQNAIWEFNSNNADDKKVWIRIGVHLGDILIEEDSIFGEGVNLAARIQALSQAGGVCITQQVFDQIKHRLDVGAIRLEMQDLKNVTDVPALYYLDLPHALSDDGAELRKRRRSFFSSRKNIVIAGSSLAVLVVVGLLAWTYFGYRTILSRGITFVKHAPKVCHRVIRDSAEKMNSYYELDRRGGKIVRVERVVKPNTYPSNVSDVWNLPLAKSFKRDYPIREYKYDGDGIAEESVFDAQGDLRYKLVYSDGGKTATVHGDHGFVKTFENQISGFSYKFDDRGNIISMKNHNVFGAPRSDDRGVVAYRYTYNDEGLVTSASAFDALGNRIEDKRGISTTKTVYDAKGLAIERTFYDRFGAVEESVDGYAITSMKYDDRGRLTMESYGDRSKHPVFNDSGACAIRYSYDDEGRLVEKTTMSCSMHPKADSYGYATTRFEYSGDRISKQSFFGHTGKAAVNNNGIASMSVDYDSKGYVSRLAFYNSDDKPAMNKKQFHAVRYIYDDAGRPTSRMFYGLDDTPAIAFEGFAEARLQYNDRGDPKKLTYLDTSGKLVNSRDGYAVVNNEYDQFGNLTVKAFFDKDDLPTFGRGENCHRISYQYDDDGDMSEVRCFDGKGVLTTGLASCAIRKYTYDNLGLKTRSECYIDEGVFIDLPSVPSILTTTYDERGYKSEIRAFDAKGKLAERYNGAAIMKMKNDDLGNQLEVATYDRFGNLTNNPKYNAALFRQEFDARGNMVRAKAFDSRMKPTPGIWGFGEIVFEYDSMDRRTSEEYIGIDGAPAINWRGVYGVEIKYDEGGQKISTANLGVGGKLAPDNEGVAVTRYSYDEWGQLVGLSFEDAGENPSTNKKSGCSSLVYARDDRGNPVEIRCFEAEEKLCERAGCIPVTEQSFDDRGRLVGQSFKGGDGKPVLNEDEAAGYLMTHDSEERISTKNVIGLDGDRSVDRFGAYGYQLHYRRDRDESLWFMTFLSKDGKRSRSKSGAVMRIVFFDRVYKKRLRAYVDVAENGSALFTRCFDVAGNPNGQNGCVTSAEVQKKRAAILPVLNDKSLEKGYE